MREMSDVSAILNNATAKSLVLIDELGKAAEVNPHYTRIVCYTRCYLTLICAYFFFQLRRSRYLH